MRNKNIGFRLKKNRAEWFVFAARKKGRWMAIGERGEGSAALALPARHPTATADIYIFTVGLFYRGLQGKQVNTVRWLQRCPGHAQGWGDSGSQGLTSPDGTGS